MDGRAAGRWCLLAGLGSCVCAGPARADAGQDTGTWALDRVGLSLGSYRNDLNLNASVNGEIAGTGTDLDGTDIDFERDFDFGGSHQLILADAFWRPFEHHQFSFGYLSDTRKQSRRLQRDIVFNGDIFPVDAEVRARFQYELFDARYTWWPLLTRQDAFGLTLGLVAYRLELGLSGELSVGGVGTTETQSASVDGDVPAPLVGLDYRHAFNEDWRMFADVSAFKASINAIDGRVTNLNAGLEYYPWRHVGFALLYTGYELVGDVERHGFEGRLKLRSSGYQLQLRLRD
jgi:hypothetical protein